MHNPTRARVACARYLTAGGRGSDRRVVHLELDVSRTPLEGSWTPGDSIGVVVPNEEAAVAGLLRRLRLAADTVLRVEPAGPPSPLSAAASVVAAGGAAAAAAPVTAAAAPAPAPAAAPSTAAARIVPQWLSRAHGLPPDTVPASELLRWCLDISSPPKKAFVRALADAAVGVDKAALLTLCGRGGRALWDPFFETQRLSLLDILQLFPSCAPSLDLLLSALPPLPPRYYSLASSALADPRRMAIAFTVVEYECGINVPPTAMAVGSTPLPDVAGTGTGAGAGAAAPAGSSNRLAARNAAAAAATATPAGASAGTPPGPADATSPALSDGVPVTPEPLPGSPNAPLSRPAAARTVSTAGVATDGVNGAPGAAADDCAAEDASATTSRIRRRGLATTYLERLCAPLLKQGDAPGMQHQRDASVASVLSSFSLLSTRGDDSAAVQLAPTPSAATTTADTAADTLTDGAAGDSAAGPFVLAFLRPNRHFNVPAPSETPFAMIGPGTGVAPFIGFLQHRHARMQADELAAVAVCRGWLAPGLHISGLRDESAAADRPACYGSTLLFFGNRHPDADFLYRDALSELQGVGALSRLFTAFSREGPAKVYVQHRMREHGKLLADMVVDGGGSVFVCGDGMQMARDVHEALVEILTVHRPAEFPSRQRAEEHLQAMAKADRYCRDVWS
jgi:sulfite reductase alpha subunit-like flavoprotein